MDLLDLIEHKRFVGREFLMWLWFESEAREGTLSVRGEGTFGLWLEAQITLDGLFESKEQSKLRGEAPASTSEAREALRRGKLPSQARIRIERNELTFTFVFHADSLGLTSVRLPTTLKEEGDEEETFYDRIQRLEELETLLGALYRDFVKQRLSSAWEADVVPRMRDWITTGTASSPEPRGADAKSRRRASRAETRQES
jgi:hypothetical protein